MTRPIAVLISTIVLALHLVRGDSEIWPVKTSSVYYYQNDSTGHCNLLTQACTPLSDVWGIDFFSPSGVATRSYALVAAINGLDVVDLTDLATPVSRGFVPSCFSEDRYTLSYYTSNYTQQTLFSVTDFSPLCQCNPQTTNCSLQIRVTQSSQTANLNAVWVPISSSLPQNVLTAPISYPLVPDGCASYPISGTGSVTQSFVVVNRLNCSIALKIAMAQAGGAKGVIVVNYRNDTVFSKSSLAIDASLQGINLTIPAMFVSSASEAALVASASASLSSAFTAYSPYYSTPPGLTIVDLSALNTTSGKPVLVKHLTDYFNFSSRMHVSPGDPVAYVVGADSLDGGMVVLDVTDPHSPFMLGTWQGVPLTDVIVATCGNYKLAFCVSPTTNQVIVIDVTNASSPETAFTWTTPYAPHSSSPDASCGYLYVVYQGAGVPSDVFALPSYSGAASTANSTTLIAPSFETFYYPSNQSALAQELVVYSNFLYIADAGVSLFDISKPLKPSLVARTGGYASETFVATAGVYARNAREVYLVDQNRGLFDLQYEEEQVVEEVNLTRMGTGATVAAALLSIGALTVFWVAFVLFRVEHWIKQ